MGNQTLSLSALTAEDLRHGRHALQHALEAWGCGLLPEALLMFNELATNAVVHASGAPEIFIVHGAATIRIEVHDAVHAIPQQQPAPEPTQGGFGLNIVNHLCDGWGWMQTATGKVVWPDVAWRPDEL